MAGAHNQSADIALFPVSKIKWREGPPSLPKGAMISVLEGDPTKEGPFVFRVKIPDGYRVPPHTHPKTERVTVISGTFNIGMGDKLDESSGTPLTTGGFGLMPAGENHFAYTKTGAEIHLYAQGPIEFKYVNPADDPRNQKK